MIVGNVPGGATKTRRIVRLSVVAASVAAMSNAVAGGEQLRGMLEDATACSDAVLHDYAANTCDSPETIAAMAVAKCKAKWDAVTDQAVDAPASDASPKERARSRTIYSAAMENEYVRMAELKAIDIRTDAGRCGFE